MLKSQTIENPDQIGLDEAIQQMEGLQEVVVQGIDG